MRLKFQQTAIHAPSRVETAEQLSPLIGKSADWIRSRTGVERRHICEEPLEVFAAHAARKVLGKEVPDLLIYASASPRQLIPDTSVFVARELGFDGIACYTIHATCLSFLVAVHTAGAFFLSGSYRKILIVSAEISSGSRRLSEPESAAILGDGAAAALLVPTPQGQHAALLAHRFSTFPEAAELAEFPGAGTRHHPNSHSTHMEHNTFTMEGPKIYRFAMRRIGAFIDEMLSSLGLTISDINLFVPHQASGPALDALGSCGIPKDKVINIVGEYGNCIAASIPMALALANQNGQLRRGDLVMLIGTGAGLSLGASILRW